ncbi:type II toxin-antitoxin system Phd/YefM family antitoxin [Desulfobacter latus]|uniref:Antitoxin n=1 Tax=Desulfobacter latus TaxID=2292 RepID=A0A850T3Q3_9BACT|nr:type II toxin-antitoxin system Phd/YefM family antitoxin [Desulfobacter latus]NWH07000.1 type II toxin-antitoxin system Phd/YefM family antitoxin [Desulfobacter latus]
MPTRKYVSYTLLSKNTAATLNSIESGETDKLIILKNNSSKAILMSFESYEAMEEERSTIVLFFFKLSFC